MSDPVTLSVIVTAHNETLVCGPTMKSADVAIACAEDAGITVERIIALDNATDQTTAWFNQSRFDHWTRMTFAEGDLGRVRNAVVPLSNGRFIAFLDSDDLFSRTWLREGVRTLQTAETRGERVIAHPELNWLFDGAHAVYSKPDQDDPLFSPYHFYTTNYYDSLCMTPRAAHLAHPYVHRDIPAGLSFQDWQFSIETMADGWKHIAARNTIIFKRRRDESLVNESRARRAVVRQLDPMAVDRVENLSTQKRETGAVFDASALLTPQTVKSGVTPHYGQALLDRVARAKARRGPDAYVNHPAYSAIKEVFDYTFYLSQNKDILALEAMDPVAHYMRSGWREQRDPAPWFNTRAYLDRHPDLQKPGQQLDKALDKNPFYHWLTVEMPKGIVPPPVVGFETLSKGLGYSEEQTFALWKTRYDDLRERLDFGALGDEVHGAAAIEPLIEQGWMDALGARIPPFHNNSITGRTVAMIRLVQSAGHTRARHVICVNRARFGSAPRVEGHVARALAAAEDPRDVLVITTEHAGKMPAGKFPEGVRVVDFAEIVTETNGDLRQRTLVEFLRALHPLTVTNVNSRLLWDAMGPYGTALSASMRLYACLLCNEKTPMGHWTGYPIRRFYRHFDQLSGVFTDSDYLTDDLRERYAVTDVDAGRIQTLSNPVDPSIPVTKRNKRLPRPQVFWAGRLDAQKRVDLVYDIARAMPHVDFRMWGDAVMSAVTPDREAPQNVMLEGAYAQFEDLPFGDADLWLYTAAWDGVPTMLLEVAMTGIPLVGSDIGGTREVLQEGLATALPPRASLADWTAAIEAVLADPDGSRRKALTLRDRLVQTRTPEAHQIGLLSLLQIPQ